MPIKIEDFQHTKWVSDLRHKAALLEVLRFTSKLDREIKAYYGALKPFLCFHADGEPSRLFHVLGYIYEIGGLKKLQHVLDGDAFKLLDEYMSQLEGKGGHSVEAEAAFVFLRLALGAYYERVLEDEKDWELLSRKKGSEQTAIETGKKRVQRAERRLTDFGGHVYHMDAQHKAFLERVSLAVEKLELGEGNASQPDLEG